MNLSVLTIIALLVATVLAVDEQDAMEFGCLNIQPNPTVDLNWLKSIQKWYYPMWSQLDFYRAASDLLKVPVEQLPYGILTKQCLTSDSNFVFTGLGQSSQLNVTFDAQGRVHGQGAYYTLPSTSTFALTDNRSYVVGIVCWDDNQAAYSVWSPQPEPLPASIRRYILNYILGLGFHVKNFLEFPCVPEAPLGCGYKTY